MPDYLIQDIPADTKRDFKTACAHFKKSMRKELLDSMVVTIRAYLIDIAQLNGKPPEHKKKEVK